MRRLDLVKLGLLLTAIIVWFLGSRSQNRSLMTAALAMMVVAFSLRFFKTRPPGPSSP